MSARHWPSPPKFGVPNRLCSSITKSKHIDVVNEPWHQSSRWEALKQMLTTNSHNDKLAAAHVDFASCGILKGTILEDILHQLSESHPTLHPVSNSDDPGSDS